MKKLNLIFISIIIVCISVLLFRPYIKDHIKEIKTNRVLEEIAEKNGLKDVRVERIGWSRAGLWIREMTAADIDTYSPESLLETAEDVKDDIEKLPKDEYEEISFFNEKYAKDTLYILMYNGDPYAVDLNEGTVYKDNKPIYKRNTE